MKKLFYITFLLVLTLPLIATVAWGRLPMLTHGRLDMRTCNYCHSMTYGIAGTGNLAAERSELCLVCHSEKTNKDVLDKSVVKRGRMQRYVARTDIMTEVNKTYAHPVLKTSNLHRRGEELPEKDPDAKRHVACTDCHDYHQLSSLNKLGPLKVTGTQGEPNTFKDVRDMIPGDEILEYELCFNCHGDSENLPLDENNKRVEFSTGNPSYHPVIAEGKNSAVPSLKRPYTTMKKKVSDISVIKCTACHGSDDEKGPKGPHGSKYPYILVKNYSINDNQAESSYQYDLCYMCHDRDSILRNDSFKYHSLHIRGNIATKNLGTSCYTCHSAHGSADNKFLIKFNKDVVFTNTSTTQIKFVSTGTFSGECYLSCHGVNHNPKSY